MKQIKRLFKVIIGFVKIHKLISIIIVGAPLIGVFIWLFFFHFAFHLSIFNIETKVNETNPFAPVTITDSPAETTPDATTPDATTPDATTTTTDSIQSPSSQFVNRSHPTKGTASLLRGIIDGEEKTFLRFESDFETDNGPRLVVYLSKTSRGVASSAGEFDDDFINLGGLKGTNGSQNYEIPAGTDLSDYDTIAIWCEPFKVVFGAAPLPELPN